MAQQVKVHATKPDEHDLVLRTHMVEGEDWYTKAVICYCKYTIYAQAIKRDERWFSTLEPDMDCRMTIAV